MTTAATQLSARNGPRPYVVTVTDCAPGVAVRVTGLTGWRRLGGGWVVEVENVHQAATAQEALREAGYAATYRTDEPLERFAPTPRPVTAGSHRGPLVETDATPAQVLAATGIATRRRGSEYLRLAVPDVETAERVAGQLAAAGHATRILGEPAPGPRERGVRIDEAVWQAARARLEALTEPTAVTVTLTPGMSRNAAVSAFLRALVDGATQVSAEESK